MAGSVTITFTAIPYGTNTSTTLTAVGGAFSMDKSNVAIQPTTYLTGFLGDVTVTSDTTSVAAGNGQRVIILNVSGPKFQARFGANPLAPFKGFMFGPIAAAINQPLVASSFVAT